MMKSSLFRNPTHLIRAPYIYTKNMLHFRRVRQQLDRDCQKSAIVLVYQMGKVGSLAVTKMIRDSDFEFPVYMVHWLHPNNIAKECYADLTQEYLSHEKVVSRYLGNKIQDLLDKRKIKIISIVREPVSRNLSYFFYSIEQYFPDFYRRYQAEEIIMQDLIDEFWRQQKLVGYSHIDWFENELKAVFGFDIFKKSFSKDECYTIYTAQDQGNDLEILILRLEGLDNHIVQALSAFLGVANVTVNHRNSAQDRDYYDIYQQFKKQIKFPVEYLDGLYDHPYMKLFYSDDEIAKFQEKWTAA